MNSKRRRIIVHCVWSLVMVRNQLTAQAVKAFNRTVLKNVVFREKRFCSRF